MQPYHFTSPSPLSFASLVTHGYGIAESSWLTDTTTPDAGSAENDAGDGSELHWELDEESGRMLVTFSTISSGFY